jgi:hypothetical protein
MAIQPLIQGVISAGPQKILQKREVLYALMTFIIIIDPVPGSAQLTENGYRLRSISRYRV